ncbi:MAG: nitroreductase family protein [Planctomycetota bacterium]|nr:nitroreductase family protein [Planctomycetota bacterium]
MTDPILVPLSFERRDGEEMLAAASAFRQELEARRSVRSFSTDLIPAGVIEECLRAAGSAPSGANLQPWSFVVVRDPALKRRIREAAELEEHENYEWRMGEAWLKDLEEFGTDENKPFLEDAPALIVVFRQAYGLDDEEKRKHYYVMESVGIATGFLLAALHKAGLATLTHTPSPMGFLDGILDRSENERAYLLIPVGYPADGCEVPDITRKPYEDFVDER